MVSGLEPFAGLRQPLRGIAGNRRGGRGRGRFGGRGGELREHAGGPLREAPAWRDRLEARMGEAVTFFVNTYGDELAEVISITVDRWDGKEAAERIELHVGRDLQFIRINGTIVGALAGGAIHAVATLV